MKSVGNLAKYGPLLKGGLYTIDLIWIEKEEQ